MNNYLVEVNVQLNIFIIKYSSVFFKCLYKITVHHINKFLKNKKKMMSSKMNMNKIYWIFKVSLDKKNKKSLWKNSIKNLYIRRYRIIKDKR